MSTRHAIRPSPAARPAAPGPAVPPARRLGGARWRDPRLAVGVVLVAGSVLLGSRVLAAADDTVPVWSVRSQVPAGAAVTSGAVEVDHVRLDDGADAELYLGGDEPFPAGHVASHDLAAGELVGRSDLRAPDTGAGTELPVAVEDGNLPPDLAVGDLVDVWVAGDPEGGSARKAAEALGAVEVRGVQERGGGIGGGSGAVVLLALDDETAQTLPTVLADVTSGTVVLVRVEG
jgi:hypothetical protein